MPTSSQNPRRSTSTGRITRSGAASSSAAAGPPAVPPASTANATPALTAEDLTATLQQVLPGMVTASVGEQMARLQADIRAEVASQVTGVQPASLPAVAPEVVATSVADVVSVGTQGTRATAKPSPVGVEAAEDLYEEVDLVPRSHESKHFEQLVDYRRYRLPNKSQQRSDAKGLHHKVRRFEERVGRECPVDRVDVELYPVSMLVVLESIAEQAASEGLSEGDVFHVLSDVVPRPAKELLSRAKGRIIEDEPRIFFKGPVIGYCTAIQLLLAYYCSDQNLEATSRSLFDRERAQGPLVGTETYEAELLRYTRRFGKFFRETDKKNAFLNGLRSETRRATVDLSGESTWSEIRARIWPVDLMGPKVDVKTGRSVLPSPSLAKRGSASVNVVQPMGAADLGDAAASGVFDDVIAAAVEQRMKSFQLPSEPALSTVSSSSFSSRDWEPLSEEPMSHPDGALTNVMLVNASDPASYGKARRCLICWKVGHFIRDCPWIPAGEYAERQKRREEGLREMGVPTRPSRQPNSRAPSSSSLRPYPSVPPTRHGASVFDRTSIPPVLEHQKEFASDDMPPDDGAGNAPSSTGN